MNIFESFFLDQIDQEAFIGLNDELRSMFLYQFMKEKQKSILLVTNSLFEANKFYQSIQNYTNNVLLFPMDDFLTSEALATSPELKINRLETLIKLLDGTPQIVICNLMGYLRYLPTKKIFQKYILNLKKDQEFNRDKLIKFLYNMGYEREVIVNKTGEMAVRGYVVDFFPISFDHPIRIEFWGDTIDSIRQIDIDSQLTMKELNEITIYPNTEFLCNDLLEVEEDENLKHRQLADYTNVTSIYEYLDDQSYLFYNNYAELKISYEQLLDEMYQYSLSVDLPSNTKYMNDFLLFDLKRSKYFMNFDESLDFIHHKIAYSTKVLDNFFGSTEKINHRLNEYLKQSKTVIIALSNRYQANKIMDQLENENLLLTNADEIYPNKINIILKKINCGFILDSYVVISEKELFNKKEKHLSYKTNFKFGNKVRDITKLELGDYIVHSVYGIGQYCGIKTLAKSGLKKDYIMLKYKGDDKLYLPVEKIEFLSKYTSNGGGIPKLNKIGGSDWQKTKLKVQKKIESIAGDLLKLYAEREASHGFAFPKDLPDQLDFEKEFPYQETTDQLKVIEEIKKDMEKFRPMDRLLCGDVGFGKTEVAFRAMFKAIMGGKQVAFLCPTTILSNQHYQNALERFQNFGVEIALVNRFIGAKEFNKIKKDLASGKIDLIIGTHRLLSNELKFKDLGLLVIDEEQRFGVKHKEKIKSLKANIDVLTLSATPIPRTLQMSLAGLRNLSLIETAPVNRYPVQTYVMAKNKTLLKDAIYKELSRGGQVFILYNRIEDMQAEANMVSRLVPDARVITAHGQMPKKELEDVMLKFVNHEFDVLVCTTIIETGIDIPNVNTLIIQDADRFGLSQLYQIRGRVGRSNKIAYCYLMYDPRKILSEIAFKRLSVIKDFTELGSGFAIAMRDLSIRGAGDILGSEQAGFIDTVGVELFMQMLNEEIARLKGKPVSKPEEETMQPLLDVTTTISDDYVADEELKILIHQKINAIDSYEKLHQTKQELEDRFGHLNEDLIIYMYEEWFEKMANKLNIKEVKQMRNFINIVLPPMITDQVNGELLFLLASEITRNFRFSMRGKCLVITLDTVKLEKHFIYYLIELMEIIEKALQK